MVSRQLWGSSCCQRLHQRVQPLARDDVAHEKHAQRLRLGHTVGDAGRRAGWLHGRQVIGCWIGDQAGARGGEVSGHAPSVVTLLAIKLSTLFR